YGNRYQEKVRVAISNVVVGLYSGKRSGTGLVETLARRRRVSRPGEGGQVCLRQRTLHSINSNSLMPFNTTTKSFAPLCSLPKPLPNAVGRPESSARWSGRNA